ncbi:MAG: xylulokinase [Gammaproteobacteria bacterium]|nr:xylulokinase [Gammaproteobacteria bacterium]
MYLGIDIGTSSVKTIVMNERGEVVSEASSSLSVSRPSQLMSEQRPDSWWDAVNETVGALFEYTPEVQGIGLSGQMHGAVLLDQAEKPLRPAILWNDGRSSKECRELEAAIDVAQCTGNHAMPGFTAPKLLWVRKHEPDLFEATKTILLPKDYVRLKMTGESATDMSDASGTLWLNVAKRSWHSDMLDSCELTVDQMPALFEGSDVTGVLTSEIAASWGMKRVPVVGGAGDQAAGAVGAGAVTPGICTLSLGTSGVMFAPDFGYQPNPSGGIHTFCHALPNTWHEMAVMLSAAGSLTWVSQITKSDSEATLINDIEARQASSDSVIFLPYLSGERTPHNNPLAKGVFSGLTADTDRAELGYAVLEGVAFALRDCYTELEKAGANVEQINVIGGGSQSHYWGQLIADALQRPLIYRQDAAVGPALGAARLAQLGTEGATISDVCREAPIDFMVQPRPERSDKLESRYLEFRALYADLKPHFGRNTG